MKPEKTQEQPRIPDFIFSMPGTVFGAPDCISGVPISIFSVPDFYFSVPDFYFGVPDFLSGVPDFLSGVPDFNSGVPDFNSGVPDFLSGVPDFLPGVPDFYFGIPDSIPDEPNAIPGVLISISGILDPELSTGRFPHTVIPFPGTSRSYPLVSTGKYSCISSKNIKKMRGDFKCTVSVFLCACSVSLCVTKHLLHRAGTEKHRGFQTDYQHRKLFWLVQVRHFGLIFLRNSFHSETEQKKR
ncbi:MAG: hypothetical protein LBT76_04675 [Tannerella sp.]|nr:hypothetical protein [Tannerella sp.]